MALEGGITRRAVLQAMIGGAVGLWSGCGSSRVRRRGQPLVVWSCGGSYYCLLEFNKRFGEAESCRIVYSSAPVDNLTTALAEKPRNVDVLVGRSGPGWLDLVEKDRLADEPQVFALDPCYIVVAPGNPRGIRGLPDLKRPGVRTVHAPTASNPSGIVVDLILMSADEVLEPGIWDGFMDNAVEVFDCGWKLFPPIIEGRADATIARLSLVMAPQFRGKVDLIPIPAEVLANMGKAMNSIPQRVATLRDGKRTDLGRKYVAALVGELGAEVCPKHGYLHRLSQQAEPYREFFSIPISRERTRHCCGASRQALIESRRESGPPAEQ